MSTRAGSQQQQDPNYSRNVNNSMILVLAGKSATAGRQATAGTSGVVDTGCKFAIRVVETGGKLPVPQIFATANHLFIRYLPPVIDTCGKKIMATISDYLNLKVK